MSYILGVIQARATGGAPPITDSEAMAYADRGEPTVKKRPAYDNPSSTH